MANLIATLDVISLAAVLAALAFSLPRRPRMGSRPEKSIFLFLLLFLVCFDCLLLVEWLGISHRFEALENYIGVLLPLWWLFFFNALSQSTLFNRLKHSEQRLKNSLEAANDGIWDWRIPTGEVFFSPHWYTMLGYAPGELPSEFSTWEKLLHPDDLAPALDVVNAHLKRDDPYALEIRMKTKSGQWLWVLARGKVVERSPDGAPLLMAGTHVDISRRKKDEERLHKLQNYLSNIINSMPSVLVGVDVDGRVTQWNRQAESATGIPSPTAMGMALEQAFPRLAREMAIVHRAMESGQAQLQATSFSDQEGTETYENVTVYPLLANGVQGVVIRLDDVTQKVRLEEMMVHTEKMHSLGGLAAGIAHEINNPLAAVIGYIATIKNRIFGDLKKNRDKAREHGISLENVREYLQSRDIPKMLDGIHESANRAAKIVGNMLNFSRENSRNLEPCDIKELLDAVLVLAASDYNLKKHYDFKSIEIVRQYQPDLPPVPCDRSKLQQVFFNLFRNGAEAMADKTYAGDAPRFTVRLWADEDWLTAEIEDNGPGMDEATRKRILEPFFTTKAIGKGTGLGLSVSYFIITRHHNGTMEVFSVPGECTRFVVKLPLKADPPPAGETG